MVKVTIVLPLSLMSPSTPVTSCSVKKYTLTLVSLESGPYVSTNNTSGAYRRMESNTMMFIKPEF